MGTALRNNKDPLRIITRKHRCLRPFHTKEISTTITVLRNKHRSNSNSCSSNTLCKISKAFRLAIFPFNYPSEQTGVHSLARCTPESNLQQISSVRLRGRRWKPCPRPVHGSSSSTLSMVDSPKFIQTTCHSGWHLTIQS